jgi:hypothetical protein
MYFKNLLRESKAKIDVRKKYNVWINTLPSEEFCKVICAEEKSILRIFVYEADFNKL